MISLKIKKIIGTFLKAVLILALGLSVFVLVNSSLDIYNNFAYDKAILKDTPYGWTPFLQNPGDWGSANGTVLSGEFVYVVDWLSAYNNDVVFAKVKSKLKEGYINRDLLVETNMNVKPVISVFLLSVVFIYTFKKLFFKFAA